MERVLAALPHEVIGDLGTMLADSIKRCNADKGMVHVFDKQKDVLAMATSKGFTTDYVAHFRTVKPFDSSACGRAAGTGDVVFLPDITQDRAYIPHLKVTLDENIRAIAAIPLYHDGRLVGVLSVHFAESQPRASRIDPLNLPTAQVAGLLFEIIKLKENR